MFLARRNIFALYFINCVRRFVCSIIFCICSESTKTFSPARLLHTHKKRQQNKKIQKM